MMDLAGAARAIGARCTGTASFSSVGSDSRRIVAGQLFVALRGERFDGHDFVRKALQDGASCALVDEAWVAQQTDAVTLPLLVARDTRLALGALAGAWRAGFSIPLIGVTGSNGKTTVKELCAAILRAQAELDGQPADSVLATTGNLNNDVGLPLMLLSLRPHHRAAVIEMGMNRPGEIGYLTGIANPTVAIVTNAQRAHLLGLGGLEQIAREKGEIYGGLRPDGIAVVNDDDAHAALWRELNRTRPVRGFALEHATDVSATCRPRGLGTHIALRAPEGEVAFDLALPGMHNVRNALGAAAACLAAGVSLQAVAQGLAGFRGTRGRLQLRAGVQGGTVLDDTYNANPDSVRAGIDVLAATPGRKLLVLGDMGEIGQTSAQLHDEVGGYAKSQGVDQLYALGEMSAVAARNFGEGGQHFASVEALVAALLPQMNADTVVLVKGSRFMRMERVADALSMPSMADGQKEIR